MEKEILTLEEAAELFNVSIKTFIKLLKEEKVPARKIGREWRFSRMALIQWLSDGNSQIYSSSEGETKEFFDKLAEDWEEIRKNYDSAVKNRLLSSEMLSKELTIVDIGCGDGYITMAAAPLVGKVIAVDISAAMLRLLAKKADENGITNIETLESDAQDIPLADSSVDLVCASMYLHHIEDPQLAVKEMSRILKPGGKVFIAELFEHRNQEFIEKMHDLWPGFKQTQLKEWFSKNSFSQIHIEKLPAKGNASAMEDIAILTAYKS